jgi:ABC-type multidrug transport system fused ATPase/permease subunit
LPKLCDSSYQETRAFREPTVRRQVVEHRIVSLATSRLHLCEDADIAVVMQQGRVAQRGTFG